MAILNSPPSINTIYTTNSTSAYDNKIIREYLYDQSNGSYINTLSGCINFPTSHQFNHEYPINTFSIHDLTHTFGGNSFSSKETLYYSKIEISKLLIKFCKFWKKLSDYEDYGVSLDKECPAFNSKETQDDFEFNWKRYQEFFKNSPDTSSYPTIDLEYNGMYVADIKLNYQFEDEWLWIFTNIEKTAKRETKGWVFEETSDAVAFKIWRG